MQEIAANKKKSLCMPTSKGVEHIFHQNITGILSNTRLLLDNQNIVDQFINPKYRSNIKTGNKSFDL